MFALSIISRVYFVYTPKLVMSQVVKHPPHPRTWFDLLGGRGGLEEGGDCPLASATTVIITCQEIKSQRKCCCKGQKAYGEEESQEEGG